MFKKEDKNLPSPADRVSQLTALYFPELEKETLALVAAQREAFSWVIGMAQKAQAVGNDLKAVENLHAKHLPEWKPLYAAVLGAISNIQGKASIVIKEITRA